MAVPCVKIHYGRTYFDEFMPTCLRGAVFLTHSVDPRLFSQYPDQIAVHTSTVLWSVLQRRAGVIRQNSDVVMDHALMTHCSATVRLTALTDQMSRTAHLVSDRFLVMFQIPNYRLVNNQIYAQLTILRY